VTLAASPGEDSDSHLLLLYRNQSDRQASVLPWVRRGLDRGEKIFYSTVPGDSAPMPGLMSHGDGVGRAVADGQLVLVPLAELFPGGRQPALVRDALAEGYAGVRFSAHANAALASVGERDYRAIDRLMDELCASQPVSALCQYDTTADTEPTLLTVVDSHPDAVRDQQMRLRRRGNGFVVAGEVDLGSAAVLARALQHSHQSDGSPNMVLDVSGLTFLDATGCRALVAGTDRVRRDGGTVVVQKAQGQIRKVMVLMGMDRLPGVELR